MSQHGTALDYVLLTPQEMAKADRLTIEGGVPGIELMERAGQAVARAAARMVPASGRIVILCGPGNNGGDGFIAARCLASAGHVVEVRLLKAPDALKGDALEAFRRMGLSYALAVEGDHVAGDLGALLDGADLIVDAGGGNANLSCLIAAVFGVPVHCVEMESPRYPSSTHLRKEQG